MVFSVFVISEPKISVKNHVKSPCYLLHWSVNQPEPIK